MKPRHELFIYGDADQVRLRVERHLLGRDFDQLRAFSEKLSLAVTELARRAEKLLGAEVIIAGGDDILLRLQPESYSHETLTDLQNQFHQSTGCTISFGVGSQVEWSFVNLRKAKAMGGGLIIEGSPMQANR